MLYLIHDINVMSFSYSCRRVYSCIVVEQFIVVVVVVVIEQFIVVVGVIVGVIVVQGFIFRVIV